VHALSCVSYHIKSTRLVQGPFWHSPRHRNNLKIWKDKAVHYHAMMAHRDSGGIVPLILNLEAEWLTSRHGRFNPKEIIPAHIEWVVRWGLIACTGFWRSGKSFPSAWIWTLRRQILSLTTTLTTISRFHIKSKDKLIKNARNKSENPTSWTSNPPFDTNASMFYLRTSHRLRLLLILSTQVFYSDRFAHTCLT